MTSNQMVDNELYGLGIDEELDATYTTVDKRNTTTDVTNTNIATDEDEDVLQQRWKLSSLTGNVTYMFNFKPY